MTTRLPAATAREAARLLVRRHRAHLQPGEQVTVDGRLERTVVEVDFVLEEADGHDRVTVTARVAVAGDEVSAAVDLAFDAADAFLGQWLEEGRPPGQPIDFVEAQLEGRAVEVRLLRSRPKLEAEADRLLAEDD